MEYFTFSEHGPSVQPAKAHRTENANRPKTEEYQYTSMGVVKFPTTSASTVQNVSGHIQCLPTKKLLARQKNEYNKAVLVTFKVSFLVFKDPLILNF